MKRIAAWLLDVGVLAAPAGAAETLLEPWARAVSLGGTGSGASSGSAAETGLQTRVVR